ncbi:MAG TPA: hypothetical protein VGL59_20045 [Polyangia bacterium]|jgi:hypothetical protein
MPAPHKPSGDPENIGNSIDDTGWVDGTLTAAVGSFPTLTNVTAESDNTVPNMYTLQMNTNLFTTARCQQAPGGGPYCKGWEQFFYSSEVYQGVAIQSWLLNYGPHCPANWTGSGTSDCYTTTNATPVSGSPISITNLGSLQLSGKAVQNGVDTVTLSVGNTLYSNSTTDATLYLAGAWNQVEFNIFGDANRSQASFNSGATIGAQIAFVGTSFAAPRCGNGNDGTTGETNNLSLVQGSCCPGRVGSVPILSFLESYAAGAKASFCLLNDITSIVAPLL